MAGLSRRQGKILPIVPHGQSVVGSLIELDDDFEDSNKGKPSNHDYEEEYSNSDDDDYTLSLSIKPG